MRKRHLIAFFHPLLFKGSHPPAEKCYRISPLPVSFASSRSITLGKFYFPFFILSKFVISLFIKRLINGLLLFKINVFRVFLWLMSWVVNFVRKKKSIIINEEVFSDYRFIIQEGSAVDGFCKSNWIFNSKVPAEKKII